jgi:hypothetical protein
VASVLDGVFWCFLGWGIGLLIIGSTLAAPMATAAMSRPARLGWRRRDSAGHRVSLFLSDWDLVTTASFFLGALEFGGNLRCVTFSLRSRWRGDVFWQSGGASGMGNSALERALLFGGVRRGFDGSVPLGIIRGAGEGSLLCLGGLPAWGWPFFSYVSPVGSELGLT